MASKYTFSGIPELTTRSKARKGLHLAFDRSLTILHSEDYFNTLGVCVHLLNTLFIHKKKPVGIRGIFGLEVVQAYLPNHNYKHPVAHPVLSKEHRDILLSHVLKIKLMQD